MNFTRFNAANPITAELNGALAFLSLLCYGIFVVFAPIKLSEVGDQSLNSMSPT
jgi:hypothetical protein